MKRIVWVIITLLCCVSFGFAQVGNFGEKKTKKDAASLLDDIDIDDDPTALIFGDDSVAANKAKLPMRFTNKELRNINDPRIRDMYWYALNDTTDKKRYLRAHYAFNSFGDNWSVETRMGLQSVLVEGMKTKFNVGPQLELGFKKDIHPYWAARLDMGWAYYKHDIFTSHTSTMLSDKSWAKNPGTGGDWWQQVEYTNLSGRISIMLNMVNMFAGREKIYAPVNFFVYGGAGLCYSAHKLGQRDGSCIVPQWLVGAEWGLNLTQRHMITFDVNGYWQGDDMEGYMTQNSTYKVCALFGFSYRFSRVIHFQRLGYDENFSRQQVFDAVSQEGDVIQTVIESQRNEREVQLPAEMVQAAFFQINRIELQHTYVLNLGFYAELIKSHPNQKFLVKGFADIEVGSMKRNLWLCEQRAKVVADVLTKTYGVNPDQLVVGGGDLDLDIPFLREQGHHKFNRCVIVCPLNLDYQILKVKDYNDQKELNNRNSAGVEPNY